MSAEDSFEALLVISGWQSNTAHLGVLFPLIWLPVVFAAPAKPLAWVSIFDVG